MGMHLVLHPFSAGAGNELIAEARLAVAQASARMAPAWVDWRAMHRIDARSASSHDVKRYCEDLVDLGRQPTTIAHKLTSCVAYTSRRWPKASASRQSGHRHPRAARSSRAPGLRLP